MNVVLYKRVQTFIILRIIEGKFVSIGLQTHLVATTHMSPDVESVDQHGNVPRPRDQQLLLVDSRDILHDLALATLDDEALQRVALVAQQRGTADIRSLMCGS
jgi:hypothetical protein